MAEKEKFIHGYHENGINIPGCVANGISDQNAEIIYGQMVDFAKYAFNKSHAACYAAISMETAYLKAHYPMEFAAGLLTSVMDKTDKLAVYTADFRKKGIQIANPDVNSSFVDFSVSENHILYGLASIKNVSSDIIKEIVNERSQNGTYKNMTDFVRRCPNVNKKTVEYLIKAGAFDFLKKSRSSLLAGYAPIVDGIKEDYKKNIPGQMSFFDLLPDDAEDKKKFRSDSFPDIPEMDNLEKLKMEKEAAGLYLTSHPIEQFSRYLGRHNSRPSLSFVEDEETGYPVKDGESVIVAGLITDLRITYTKKDNRPMAFLSLEDQYGMMSAIAFPNVFDIYSNVIRNDALIIVKGRTNIKEGRISIVADMIGDLTQIGKDLCIYFQSSNDLSRNGSPMLGRRRYEPGFQNIYGFIKDRNGNFAYKVMRKDVNVSKETVDDIVALFGKDRIAFWQ